MKLIDFHTHHHTESDDVISVINQYPNQYVSKFKLTSVGIHPWFIDVDTIDRELSILEDIIQNQDCVAIGECGLDKNTEVSFRLQRAVFRKQLRLAEEYQKPVIIHCVSSFQQVIADKSALVSEDLPLIIHGFAKKVEMAHQLIDHGFYLSFGSNLLKSKTLQNAFINSSRDRIFLETGSHDETILEIYKFAAELLELSITELNEQITANYNAVFKSQKGIII